jgi:hypothetical protein
VEANLVRDPIVRVLHDADGVGALVYNADDHGIRVTHLPQHHHADRLSERKGSRDPAIWDGCSRVLCCCNVQVTEANRPDHEAAMIDLDAALRAAPTGESEMANPLGGHVHAGRFVTLVTGELEHKSMLG